MVYDFATSCNFKIIESGRPVCYRYDCYKINKAYVDVSVDKQKIPGISENKINICDAAVICNGGAGGTAMIIQNIYNVMFLMLKNDYGAISGYGMIQRKEDAE
ncbi:hypothetical protein ACFSQD_11755 [Flavihumibacter stibioxidans]|uniref:Uncharacterized protein n=1 Tax=Flavihumibacter stibioxidans TaxID=1834163 RepID=A0ABR7M9I9_9BACT|nr:hypothetical protein [Flavihumibacter stibioxidans]MBC6491698.1 hypothetical protein [Flavihumibacter stibioxidans]